jgi:hypothetical protein
MSEEVERMWSILREYGITNMEKFNKAVKENELNVGIFTIRSGKNNKGNKDERI